MGPVAGDVLASDLSGSNFFSEFVKPFLQLKQEDYQCGNALLAVNNLEDCFIVAFLFHEEEGSNVMVTVHFYSLNQVGPKVIDLFTLP